MSTFEPKSQMIIYSDGMQYKMVSVEHTTPILLKRPFHIYELLEDLRLHVRESM
jgi:hypothetical protein